MGKPIEHAKSSVESFGGKAEDYLPIHELLDSSNVTFGDVRHRVLTHTKWFISTILIRVFGHTIINSDGDEVSVERIAEQHIVEDFPNGGIIPTVQDWLALIPLKDWMINDQTGAVPPSRTNVPKGIPATLPKEWDHESDDERRIGPDRNYPLNPFEQTRGCQGAGPGVMD